MNKKFNTHIDNFILKHSLKILDPLNIKSIINKDFFALNNTSNSSSKFYNPLTLDLGSGIPGLLYLANELEKVYKIEKKATHIDSFIELLLNLLKKQTFYDVSLFGGLSGINMALISLKRSDLTSVIHQINSLIYQLLDQFIDECEKDSYIGIRSMEFDWMYGFAGILNYLCFIVDSDLQSQFATDYIKKIQNFLINKFSSDIKLDNTYIHPWYVSKENQMISSDKKAFPFGNYNPSLSHGVAGFLQSLVKSESVSPSNKVNILEKKLYNFIIENCININSYPQWPLMIPLDDKFKVIKLTTLTRYDSWCYGTPGILYALNEYATTKKKRNLIDFCKKNFEFLNKDINNIMGLTSPIICHGYSGLLMILKKYEEKNQGFGPVNSDIEEKILTYYNSNLEVGFFDKRYSNNTYLKIPDIGILSGTSGILLSLIYNRYGDNSYWTRIFL